MFKSYYSEDSPYFGELAHVTLFASLDISCFKAPVYVLIYVQFKGLYGASNGYLIYVCLYCTHLCYGIYGVFKLDLNYVYDNAMAMVYNVLGFIPKPV